MALADSLQRGLERFSIFFQGGVRRGILYFLGICLVLAWPMQYVGKYAALLVGQASLEEGPAAVLPGAQQADLDIGPAQFVELASGERDFYLEVDNKANPRFGFSPWIYELRLLDDTGRLIESKTRESYVLPGDAKYVTLRDTTGTATRMELVEQAGTQIVDYNPEANPFQRLPQVTVSNEEIRPGALNQLQVRALFTNRDKLRVGTMDVTYIIRNRRQEIIGIGEGQFNGFTPGETRDFIANHPANASEEAQFPEIEWSTNYLQEGNVEFTR